MLICILNILETCVNFVRTHSSNHGSEKVGSSFLTPFPSLGPLICLITSEYIRNLTCLLDFHSPYVSIREARFGCMSTTIQGWLPHNMQNNWTWQSFIVILSCQFTISIYTLFFHITLFFHDDFSVKKQVHSIRKTLRLVTITYYCFILKKFRYYFMFIVYRIDEINRWEGTRLIKRIRESIHLQKKLIRTHPLQKEKVIKLLALYP